jgi:hypothetical protein
MKTDRLLPLANVCPVVLLLLLAFAPPASATLGHSASNVASDQKAMKLERSKTETVHGYRIVTLSSADFSVKEFVNPQSGLVFAVSWSGQRPPDIQTLVGFDPAKVEGAKVYRSLRFEHVESPTLVIDFGGLPGAFSGTAVRLDLLPAGAKASEVTLP